MRLLFITNLILDIVSRVEKQSARCGSSTAPCGTGCNRNCTDLPPKRKTGTAGSRVTVRNLKGDFPNQRFIIYSQQEQLKSIRFNPFLKIYIVTWFCVDPTSITYRCVWEIQQ